MPTTRWVDAIKLIVVATRYEVIDKAAKKCGERYSMCSPVACAKIG